MNKQTMIRTFSTLAAIALISMAAPLQSVAGENKPFPVRVPTLQGSASEGFAIGKGHVAFNSSPDGSIFRVDLRSGEGEVLVEAIAPQDPNAVLKLGMRVDDRTNYLFVAGAFNGNALVFEADTGALIMEYQLNVSGEFSVVNDLTITEDAVYFTDSARPVLYRLPLLEEGRLSVDPGAATEVPLPDAFKFNGGPAGNGIVSTPDGKTIIIGNSSNAQLYRLDTLSGDVTQISVDGPLSGFLDGIAMRGSTLYIMTPYDFPGPPISIDRVQVVELDKDYLSGALVDTITDAENLDGVASGAIFGSSLYVNNARYAFGPPGADTPFWITKLKLRPGK